MIDDVDGSTISEINIGKKLTGVTGVTSDTSSKSTFCPKTVHVIDVNRETLVMLSVLQITIYFITMENTGLFNEEPPHQA
jgi:hypothetical protein